MRRALFLLLLAGLPAAAQQTKVLPDCVIDFSFTAGGQTQGGAGTCGNNTAGVVQWTLWYKSTGFSALSLRVESASDSSGSPGSWGSYAGTVVSGVNPNTSTTQDQTTFKDFEPWVRVALNSATGSGRVTGQLYGCRQPGCSGGLAVSTGPSGPAGGDLCGTYPDPTVCKVDGVAYPAGPSTNTVPVVTAPNTVTYEKVPNAALANSSTTVNGTPCTLGSACSPTAVPSGACGGDLGGTFPNCDVDKVHAVAYPAGPSTNTVPVVTGTNAVTYEAVPNAALANSSTTVNGTPCTLGSACSPTAVPSGACGGDLGGTFPNCDVDKVHAVAYPAGPSTNTVPVVTGTNAVTYEAVPNAALANSSITINGTPCTLGSSCAPTSGASPSGTFYLTSGGNTYGPVFPVTPPNVVSFSWRNQGGASETALGNALYLLAPKAAGDNIRGREISLPATPVSITSVSLPQYVLLQFGNCGLYFADSSSGRLVTFGIVAVGSAINLRVDHYTNVTTISGNVFSNSIGVTPNVSMKLQDTGTNDVFFISSNGGQTFIQLYSESRTAFLASPDRVGYYCNANNASFDVGTTLLSWVQGT